MYSFDEPSLIGFMCGSYYFCYRVLACEVISENGDFNQLNCIEVNSGIGSFMYAASFNKSNDENEYGGRTNVRSPSGITSKLSCGTIFSKRKNKTIDLANIVQDSE